MNIVSIVAASVFLGGLFVYVLICLYFFSNWPG
jgi:hypothetical protein